MFWKHLLNDNISLLSLIFPSRFYVFIPVSLVLRHNIITAMFQHFFSCNTGKERTNLLIRDWTNLNTKLYFLNVKFESRRVCELVFFFLKSVLFPRIRNYRVAGWTTCTERNFCTIVTKENVCVKTFPGWKVLVETKKESTPEVTPGKVRCSVHVVPAHSGSLPKSFSHNSTRVQGSKKRWDKCIDDRSARKVFQKYSRHPP